MLVNINIFLKLLIRITTFQEHGKPCMETLLQVKIPRCVRQVGLEVYAAVH